MANSPNLTLPFLDAAQAQKHVTHNDALRVLDALVQPAVLSRMLTSPPGTLADGDRYIVPAGATGAWTAQTGKIAAYQDGAWAFYGPRTGWIAWVTAETALLIYSSGVWGPLLGSLQNLAMVGINATADTTNKLAVRSSATLFDNIGNGHQIKINKAAAGDTASLLYQDGFSGRAEFGLTGDDDFHIKVSPDGSVWKEALKFDRSSGLGVVFADPAAPLGIATKQYVDAHSSGAAAIGEVEIDFGATALRTRKFSITDAAVTPASKIVAIQSGKAATGRSADENEMDFLHLRAVPGTGTFTLHAACLTGRVSGKFKVSYLVG
jgi:Protein of unknown function (DUF2793)